MPMVIFFQSGCSMEWSATVRFQDRHRAVGHFERRIVLAVAVARIMLTEPDAEHVRYFENVLLAVELLQVHA